MLELAVFFLIVFLVCYVLFRFARSLRRGGGSAATMMLGSTGIFRSSDEQRAAEIIVRRKAGQWLDEQQSGDPED